jgi:hypothetical protein
MSDLSHITYLELTTNRFIWGHPCKCDHCKRDDYALRFETEEQVRQFERQFTEQGRIADEKGIARMRERYERKQQVQAPQPPSKAWLDELIARSAQKKYGTPPSLPAQLLKDERLVFCPWRGLITPAEAEQPAAGVEEFNRR